MLALREMPAPQQARGDRAILRTPRRRGSGPLLVLGGIAIVLLLALTFKPAVQDDGVGYFAYLHSVVLDHDLDLGDEYAAATRERVVFYDPLFALRTATGKAADYFPVGPAVLAAPFYLVALALNPSGRPQFGPPISTSISLASLLYGLLALSLAYRLASQVSGRRAALVGSAGAGLATSYLYYLVYQPSYSHTFSAFAVALFLVVWWAGRRGRPWWGWLGLGLLGGLMALVRFQDGLLLAIALIGARGAGWKPLLLAPGALLAFAPQLWVDHILFGSWLPVRPPGQALQLLPGHYVEVLLSSYHGLFIWTPAAILAVVGYFYIGERRLQLAFAYALAVEIVINGATPDWWGGFAFGPRRFLDLTPFLALGLAALAARLPRWIMAAAVALLAAWNLLLMANFTYVIRTDHDPGYGGLVAGQLQALHFLPNLVAQGAVGRHLLTFRWVQATFDPGYAVALLTGEAACVVACLWLARWRGPGGRSRHPGSLRGSSAGLSGG